MTANRDGGTIARVMAQAIQRNFEIMLFSIEEAAKVANTNKLSGTMGISVSLFEVKGNLVTEVEAFNLQGAKATPIASGGLCKAEGTGVFVIEGEEKDVKSCLYVIEECKGAYLNVVFPDCEYCRYDKCPRSIVYSN